MTAIILAAGIGSRLRPLSDAVPKCLLPVGGAPLLGRTLAALRDASVGRVVIVTGYRHEQIREFVARLAPRVEVTWANNERYATTANSYSLWRAASSCEGSPFLLLDSDILFHPGLLTRVLASPHDNAIAIRDGAPLGAEEIKVQQDGTGRIVRIGKEIPPADAAGESIGIERFSAATGSLLFETLSRRKERDEFYEASFQELLDRGEDMRAVSCGDLPCMEIDTPDDYRAADHLAREIDR